MTNNRKNRMLVPTVAVLILSMIVSVFMTCTVSADSSTAKNEIVSIELNDDKTDIVIEISLTDEFVSDSEDRELYLFELYPYQSTSELSKLTPVETFEAKGEITVKLPYYIDSTTNRLHSKFVVAQKFSDGSYKLVTSAKYIENVEILAANREQFPSGSKKGLIVDSLSDAQLLGARHTVVNVPVNELMRGENSQGSSSIHHNGQTFYIDTHGIAKLDHVIKSYSDAGIAVYLNLVLTAPNASTHEKIMNFYCKDLSYGARYYAFNSRNETAMRSLQAFLDYICYRYTTPEHTYGFAPAVIVGFEVNSNRGSNSAGPSDMSNYIYSYTTVFRMVYSSLLSNYSEGRVYVSIGNNWTSKVSDLSLVPDDSYDYPAKDFLEVFGVAVKNSGDIPWGVSVNPYPSSDEYNEFWKDTRATDTPDTEFITMKNIGVLTDFLSQESLLYGGEVRSVIIGEYGVSGRPRDTASLNSQAAAYALAYYTAAMNEHIDAFIYCDQTDNGVEAPYYGLRAYSEAPASAEAVAKQPIYGVFSLIDTAQSETVTEFVASAVGSDVFGKFMGEKVKYDRFNERTVLTAAPAQKEAYDGKYDVNKLYSFTGGTLGGFYFSDGTDYIELRKTEDNESVLYAKLGGVPAEYKGISNTGFDGADIADARFLTLNLKLEAPASVDTMKLMLLLQSNGDSDAAPVVFEGVTDVSSNEWTEVTFDIGEFIDESDGEVDVLKILTSNGGADVGSGEYGIWLSSVDVHVDGGMPFILVVFIVILVLVLIAVAFYAVLFIRAQSIRKKRRAEQEQRRREMMRMQQQQAAQMHRQNGQQYGQNGQPYRQGGQQYGQNGQQYRQDAQMNRTKQIPIVRAEYLNTQRMHGASGQISRNPDLGNGGNTQIFSTDQIRKIDRGE